jgi:hypothetical protein
MVRREEREFSTMATKQKVSDRSLIGGDDYNTATGGTYTLVKATGVSPKGEPIHSPVKSFDFSPKTDDLATKAFAIFGFHTKVGNVANSVLNDKDNPGTVEQAADEIEAWLERLAGGDWVSERLSGPRYDEDKLCLAIAAAKGESDPSPYKAKMGTTVKQGSKEIPYGAYAYKIPAVRQEYDKLVGRGVDVASL